MMDFLVSLALMMLWVAIAFVLFQHVLGPILVWRSERVPAAYDLQPIEVQSVIEALDPGGAIAVANS